jgi:hypothetical protein
VIRITARTEGPSLLLASRAAPMARSTPRRSGRRRCRTVPRRSCRARRARCRKRRRRAGRLHKYRQRFQTPIGLSTTRSVPAIRARSGWPGPHQGARVSGRPAVVIISVSAVCRRKSNRKFADSPLSKCAPQSCRDKAVFAAGSSAANGRVRQLLSR